MPLEKRSLNPGLARLGRRLSWPSRRRHYARLATCVTAAFVGAGFGAAAMASSSDGAGFNWTGALAPSTAFLQVGAASDAEMLILGATWIWAWQRNTRLGRIGGYSEVSVGRWRSEIGEDGASDWVTQWGVTPVLRLHPEGWGGRWFVEVGIGANLLVPIYRTSSKRFSTNFNFGDHLAVGRQFGERGRHEIALRLQHFSNAGIDSPNPGENFLQLRYVAHF